MAKIRVMGSNGGFKMISEGVHTFKVVEVDDSKYEDFGKLIIKLQTKSGEKHQEQFSFINSKGETNEGAIKSFSFFAKVALNNFDLEDCEIDSDDLVGCYIQGEIKYETYPKNDGTEGTRAKLNKWKSATGFGGDAEQTAASAKATSAKSDIDDFLND